MQEWLDNNDVSMHSAHNEDKPLIGERFMKTLKAKFYKKATANDSKSHPPYLNKLEDQYNSTYHNSINKNLTEKIETNCKAPKFKVTDRVRITKYRNIFSKGCTEKEIFILERNIFYRFCIEN